MSYSEGYEQGVADENRRMTLIMKRFIVQTSAVSIAVLQDLIEKEGLYNGK